MDRYWPSQSLRCCSPRWAERAKNGGRSELLLQEHLAECARALVRLTGRNFSSIWPGCVRVSAAPHLDLLEHRMVFYPREEDPHCVSAILQERDSGSIQLLSELVDVGLQLCKRCGESQRMVKLGEDVPEQNKRVELHHQVTVEP